MKKIFLNLLNFIYRKKCCICGQTKENTILCKKCFENLDYRINKPLFILDNSIPVYSASFYKEDMKKLIHLLKYNNKKELSFYLGSFLNEYFNKIDINKNFLIIPVPLFYKKENKRKFNQSELISKILSEKHKFNINTSLLKRIKNTKPLFNLSKEEREKNIKNSFSVDRNYYKGENILLIDDIITTGTTIKEIIKTFQEKNINNITVLTLSCSTFFEE